MNVGRGASYSRWRGHMESILVRAFDGGWPAELAFRAGFQRSVRLLRHHVTAARWPKGAPPLTIGFASDFHAGPTTHPHVTNLALRTLASTRPDVLLLGGDFVLFDARRIEPLADAIAKVPAPLGRFAVLGNHDLWADDRRIVRALERAGVKVLVNASARLPPPYERVVISGLDDPWTGAPDANAAFADDADVRVLLVHAPSGLLLTRDRAFDLALAGHTHGGQIALPGGVPILAPGPLSRRYNHGRFTLAGGATLIVSRGVGMGELPVRAFADADVVHCTLRARVASVRG